MRTASTNQASKSRAFLPSPIDLAFFPTPLRARGCVPVHLNLIGAFAEEIVGGAGELG